MESPMIKAIRFKNFKALRDTELPLGRITIIVGANGTGKSTALEAIRLPYTVLTRTAGLHGDSEISITIEWDGQPSRQETRKYEGPRGSENSVDFDAQGGRCSGKYRAPILEASRVYSLDAKAIAKPVPLQPKMELSPDGAGLAGVLDRLRDDSPERFQAVNEELARWLPEFDRILFDTPGEGLRAVKLRTHVGQRSIPAADLSQGTLIALAILTLAYLPDPPPIVGLEEPDRGIHPRLLRQVQDAMYRLAFPESCGDTRQPVQVIATTHSPYLLDLFRDHPEEVVIADKVEGNVRFSRLSEMPNSKEILGDSSLGEVWYSGILGGVPTY
jgi:predicted ATPase